jgi:anti-anti-sigma regulatory factor
MLTGFVSGIATAYVAMGARVVGMLRITVVESSRKAVRLRVEGRVTDRSVEELRRTCDLHTLGDGIRLTLDLADVSFVDAAGIELLKQLRIRCVNLLSPSSFVAEQLKSAPSCDDPYGLDQSFETDPYETEG